MLQSLEGQRAGFALLPLALSAECGNVAIGAGPPAAPATARCNATISYGTGAKGLRLAAVVLAMLLDLIDLGSAGASPLQLRDREVARASFILAGNDLDWLLYKPNTDYLNFPNRRPGYREPGDAPYVPEPLPEPPPPGGRKAAPLEASGAIRSGSKWRKGMLACEVVRQRIAAAGYANVRAVDCEGEYYGYTATQDEARLHIDARARDGVIVSRRRTDDSAVP